MGVLVGLVIVVLSALADRGALGPWSPARSELDVLLAASTAGLVAFGLLALAPARWARVIAAVGAVAVLVPTGFALLGTLATGLPGPSAGLLAVGAVTLALGALARARRPGRPPWQRPVAAASFLLVVVAVAVVAAVLAVDVPVTATSTAPGTAGAPAAGTSGAILWRSPPYPEVRDVRAAGAGSSSPAATTCGSSTARPAPPGGATGAPGRSSTGSPSPPTGRRSSRCSGRGW